jgi:hypothetical protein
VFVNLYYEYNNPLLDFVFSEKSNLKCVLYGTSPRVCTIFDVLMYLGDVHTADEKVNYGGQQLEPPPAATTYIRQSTGFTSLALMQPAVPDGYELVFGPLTAANNAPGVCAFFCPLRSGLNYARSTWALRS